MSVVDRVRAARDDYPPTENRFYDALDRDARLVFGSTQMTRMGGRGRPCTSWAPCQPAVRPTLDRASLYFAVFVSGAVLLGVEIASSRVLAPFFGNSLYVWGALIGVVLTGLAIGYRVGGALADRWPSVRLLLCVMALGALLVLAIPFADDRILRWVIEWTPACA